MYDDPGAGGSLRLSRSTVSRVLNGKSESDVNSGVFRFMNRTRGGVMMQHEIVSSQRLLNEKGNIAEPGFAKKQYWQYDRRDIRAPKWRIKEWDYYYIGCQDYGLCLTISDAGYVSSLSVSLLTYGDNPEQWNDGAMGLFPLGKLHLPGTSVTGDISARVGRADMAFLNDGITRRLKGRFDRFAKSDSALIFDITLTDIPEERDDQL